MSKFKIVFIDKFYHIPFYMGNIRQHFDSKKFARQYFSSIKEIKILKWKSKFVDAMKAVVRYDKIRHLDPRINP